MKVFVLVFFIAIAFNLKAGENNRHRQRRPPRRQPGGEPEQEPALESKIHNDRQASRPQRNTQGLETRRLNPITAGTHVAEKVYVRMGAGRDALRGLQQDAFIVGQQEPAPLQEREQDHDGKENQDCWTSPHSELPFPNRKHTLTHVVSQ